jgi:hypothetical protein
MNKGQKEACLVLEVNLFRNSLNDYVSIGVELKHEIINTKSASSHVTKSNLLPIVAVSQCSNVGESFIGLKATRKGQYIQNVKTLSQLYKLRDLLFLHIGLEALRDLFQTTPKVSIVDILK